jgi:hypothetical protein
MNRRALLRYGLFGVAASAAPGVLPAAGSAPATPQAGDGEIASAVIHPAVGIARVGDSPDGWFLGPETGGPHPLPEGGFKDGEGRILRQAARFRVYGLDRAGKVVRELTAADAEIEWAVHLANQKAAWYDFDTAFDIPGAMGLARAPMQDAPDPLQSALRNRGIRDRSQLTIDPGPRSISGASANLDGSDGNLRFDTGRFFGKAVDLGELRTDDSGRLLVFGGRGQAAPAVPGLLADTFANNDLWHDDISDGPVDARVRIDGREIPVTGAWIVVGPPNFAPGVQSVVTMYDLMFEVACRLDPARTPARPSFARQIYPIFARLVSHQWVNGGFLRDFGWGSTGDFLAPDVLAQLADPGEDSRFLRTMVYERFRNPAYTSMEYDALPPYYGDDVYLPANNPRQWMALLPMQHGWLEQWAAGDFDADWPAGGLVFPERIEAFPVEEQPAALDRAALDECLGGPFHPGCEMTWPMRQEMLYAEPFRLNRRTGPERSWGPVMTSKIALSPEGPLAASGPGALSRWMAVPWQTDTSSCLSRYKRDVDDYLPAFWPARVPNDVLAPEQYAVVMNGARSLEERQRAFNDRVKWLRGLPGFEVNSIERVNAFIVQWSRAGVVTRQPGPADGAPFPEEIWVELGDAIDDEDPAGPPQTSPDLATPTGSGGG